MGQIPEDLADLTREQIQGSLHELRVHQIELEMQNEELRRVQVELGASRTRYFDLYDLAPVGYVTVAEAGQIMEANLTAAALLGTPRSHLAGRPFASFVFEEDEERYYLARKQLFESGEPQGFEVRMVKKDHTIFWAHLDVSCSLDPADKSVRRIVLNDISERKRFELILAARSRLLVLAQDCGITELLRVTLDEVEVLTGSTIGFYHFLEADQATLTLQAWSTHTERSMCRAEGAGRHYPVDEAGVRADCIRTRHAVIHNNYGALPNRKGLPPGHATVLRELVVPVQRDKRIVAILGVGNKATDYSEEDTQTVTSLADLAWGIVEIKLAQEALRVSEEKFRAIANYTVDFEAWVGPDGLCRWVNPAAARITGYAAEEILALPDFGSALIAEEDLALFREHFQQALAGVPGHDYEFRFLHRNGTTRWLSVSWQSIYDSSGHCLGFRSSGRDITEHKHEEDVQMFLARTSSGASGEPFFNTLARYLARTLEMDFVCIDRLEGDGLNARTVAVWCDGHFEDDVTYALKDTPCGDVVSQAACCFPAGVCQVFPRDQVLQDLRAESYVGSTLWSHDGKPIGLIAVIGRRPLANRALAETTLKLVAERAAGELERLEYVQALQEAEWKFRALFEKGPIGVAYHAMIFDAAGTPIDYRFLDANASYRELTGVDPRGMNASEAFPGIENDPSDWIGTFGRVARTGEPIRFERYLESNHRWYDCAAYQYKPDHFVAAFLEITRRKQAEGLLQDSLSEKESLLKEIHHRVKNNLQIISSLLRLQSGQSSHPDAKTALLDMQNRVHSMALIHEHLYRSENLAAVDLAEYLRGLCHQLLRTLVVSPGSIQLHLDLASIRMAIDRAIPCGLLVNELVSNAFKHAFPGGRSGEVRVELHALTDGTGWQLRVADNGVGLPPGFALDDLTSLGLKLVSDLTRQLGARLEIGAGPGTVFEVEFKERGS